MFRVPCSTVASITLQLYIKNIAINLWETGCPLRTVHLNRNAYYAWEDNKRIGVHITDSRYLNRYTPFLDVTLWLSLLCVWQSFCIILRLNESKMPFAGLARHFGKKNTGITGESSRKYWRLFSKIKATVRGIWMNLNGKYKKKVVKNSTLRPYLAKDFRKLISFVLI